jgi:transposase
MKPRALSTGPAGDASVTTKHTCPLCAGDLIRIPRRATDHLLSLFVLVHRFRCPGFSCQWEGNLRVRIHACSPSVYSSLRPQKILPSTFVELLSKGRPAMSSRKKLNMIASNVEVAAGEAAARATPDPEVHALAKRRKFDAAYKLAVLSEADRLTEPGAVGALLRREALDSSQLTSWRREREAGALGRRRGGKARFTPEQKRVVALEAKNARLERELEEARLIIEVQKKRCTLLGLPTTEDTPAPTGSES